MMSSRPQIEPFAASPDEMVRALTRRVAFMLASSIVIGAGALYVIASLS